MNGFWLIIVQIGIIDIVFSLDSVFTADRLAKHIEVMVAAIVVSVLVMMVVSSAVGRFIDRYPTIKVLALAFLVLVGRRADRASRWTSRFRRAICILRWPSRRRWNGSTYACDGGAKV